jgi:DNA invertase Pin-like site-specific DNA recombinase
MTPDRSHGRPHTGRYVALYRVSTKKQGDSGLGLEAQREAVNTYLNGGPWTLIGSFTEIESGRTRKRPQLMKALEMCRKEKATLIVAKLDRLYRNVHAMTALMESGINFVACDNPHANKLTIHLLAAIAEHESDLIGQRTSAALQTVSNKIKKQGYHEVKDSRGVVTHRILALGSPSPMHGNKLGVATLKRQADDFAVKVMPIVRELTRHGYSTLREIARGLTDRGVSTPRGNLNWHPSQVANLLKRRA